MQRLDTCVTSLDRLGSRAAEIARIRAEGWRAGFRCGLFREAPTGGQPMAWETNTRSTAIGGELGLHICPGDSADDSAPDTSTS